MDNKEKFIKYEELLKEWSKRMNLVAPSTLSDIENRHFKDSAQLANFIPRDAKIVDLGSGAGFPGVVLAILGWDVICIESIRKKAGFLSILKQELDLPNLTVINDRIEAFFAKSPAFSKNFVFTARAFAPLIKIFDYTHKQNCRLFLLKGREIENEILTAKTKYKFDYELHPSTTGDGYIIIVKNLK